MCHTRGLSPPYAGAVPTEFPELGTVPSNQGVCPRRFARGLSPRSSQSWGLSSVTKGSVPAGLGLWGLSPRGSVTKGSVPAGLGLWGLSPRGSIVHKWQLTQMFTNHKWQKFVLVAIVNN